VPRWRRVRLLQETVLAVSTVRGLGRVWGTPISGGPSAPAVVDGVVYVGSRDGKVLALSAATGATIWTVATGGEVSSSPAVAVGWCTSARGTASSTR
jgi:outer membrane protein assembly factor BamB